MDNRIKINKLLERRKRLKELEGKWQPRNSATGVDHTGQIAVMQAIKQGFKKIFIRAGRRSGKTEIACYLATSVAGLVNNATVSIITPSLKQGRKIYWKKRKIQNFPPSGWVGKEQNDDLTLYFNNGSYIEIDGSENIDAHRGDEKDLVILDEYKDIDERFYSEVVEPMLATTDGIVVFIGTPPETPESHYRDLEKIAKDDPGWKVIHWSSYDSPFIKNEWLDEKRQELAKRGEDDVFRREYLAEYTIGGKNSVFPMASREIHMKPAPVVHRYFQTIKDRCELYWMNDPGTSTVFGGLFIAYYREKGQVLFLREIYAKEKSETHTKAIVEKAKDLVAPFQPEIGDWRVAYDDAAIWFANELLHEHGMSAYPANKAAVKKEEGIALFKTLLLKKNAVIISEECENLMTEIENYIMLDGMYPKKNDHLIDCVRYFLIFAHVVLSLAENGELNEDVEEFYDDYLERLYDQTDLPVWTQ